MWSPAQELRRFVAASLVTPVPRDHWQSPEAFRRRRIAATITLIVGIAVFFWAMRIPAGDPLFYPATIALGTIWVVGALVSGPLHLGRAHTRAGRNLARPVLQPFLLGLVILGVFLAGAVVVAKIPVLRAPVNDLLDHARFGSVPLIAAITAFNGITEEMFFRGALFAAIDRRYNIAATTLIYAMVTAFAAIPLLVFAALLIGFVVGLQRRVTGGLLAPIITHITWSVGMLLLLPVALDAFS